MLPYKAIQIYTSEAARDHKKPVVDTIVQYIRNLKIAARCIVTRGIAGCYENGEEASGRLEILSFNLPVRIDIVLPAVETDRVLDGLNGMVGDGIIAVQDLNVVRHRARNAFFPRQLLVRDVMTPAPKRVVSTSPLRDAVRLLLSSIFTGLPVVDEKDRPIGIITQGDLVERGGLPLRLGLLAASDQNRTDMAINALASRTVADAMTTPAVTIADGRPLTEAVELMLAKGLKRLPVVDKAGGLTGMLSRLDIFRTVMREAPDWSAFRAQKIDVEHLRCVGDILRRDTHTVSPDTAIDEVIRIIDDNDIQRVAVVDAAGKLLGLISDRDLLRYFKPEEEGLWHFLSRIKPPSPHSVYKGDLWQCLGNTKACEVMTTGLITVSEEMLIEEAIGLMTEEELKRLPVVDAAGRFKGMISRDSLLRTGFCGSA